MKFAISLRIRGKALLLVGGLLVVFAAAVVGFAHLGLKREVSSEMTANARGAMRVLAVTFAQTVPGAHVAIDNDVVTGIVVDALPSFSDHAVVDRTAQMISGVATVFATQPSQGLLRVSTNVRAQDGQRAIRTTLAADHPATPSLNRGESYYGPATLFDRSFITGYQPIKNRAGATIGALFVGVPMERADAMVASLTTSNALATCGVLIVLAGIAGFVVARSVRPLAAMTAAMHQLAEGNLEVVLPGLGRGDEIGDIAAAVEAFKIKATEKAQREAEERAAQARAAAEERRKKQEAEERERKDAEERQELATKQAIHTMIAEFQAAVGSIIETVASAATELEASAATLTHAADSTQQRANAVAAASEEATTNVQSVASATEQLTASVDEISKQVDASSSIARQAVMEAEKTDSRVTELSQAAARIGDVVKLITAIAEQTNLLALNATIEAARAGEAGRGFAVVAQEVKALAAQTAKATGDISGQIASMQSVTQESVQAIKEIGSTIGKISEIAAASAAAVQEQGAATQEIARNVGEASKGTAEVSTHIVEVSQYASHTGAAAAQMLSSAQSLSVEGNRLKTEMERFLDTIRTGIGDRRKAEDPSYAGPERRQDRRSSDIRGRAA